MTWMRVMALALAACGGGGGFPADAEPDSPPPGGRFSLAWTITDADGAPIDCNRVGAQIVSLSLRNLSAAGGFSEAFTCSNLMGTSAAFPPGIYEINFALTGLAGELATAPVQQNIELRSNETTMLEPIGFAVEATGGVELRLETNQPGGNCNAMAAMGAGIDTMTLVVRRTDLSCEPVTFQVSAGATRPASTYTVNCDNPALALCIENDQLLTAQPVPSGSYRLQIRGKIAGTDCWTNDDTIVVPPLSKLLKSTLNLVKSPGC
jgi:hypothetical protein